MAAVGAAMTTHSQTGDRIRSTRRRGYGSLRRGLTVNRHPPGNGTMLKLGSS